MKYLIFLLLILNTTLALSVEQEPPKERPGDRCEPYPECAIWPSHFDGHTVGKMLDAISCYKKGQYYTEVTTSYGTKLSACVIAEIPDKSTDIYKNGDDNRSEEYAWDCAALGGIWVWLPKTATGERIGYCWFP